MFHHNAIKLVFHAIADHKLFIRIRLPYLRSVFTVLDLLLDFAAILSVVSHTALGGTLLTVCCSTAKGTTQIAASGVTGMGDEENPAMTAASQTLPQFWMGSQHRPQDEIILQYQVANVAAVVPVGPELEMLLDFYCKKPKLSLMILMELGMPLSYSIDTSVSRAKTRTALFLILRYTVGPSTNGTARSPCKISIAPPGTAIQQGKSTKWWSN
jgi:hypothetical protein